MKYYILDKIPQTMGNWEGIFRYGFAPYDDFNNEHSIRLDLALRNPTHIFRNYIKRLTSQLTQVYR